MTIEEAEAAMQELLDQRLWDEEAGHGDADYILTQLLDTIAPGVAALYRQLSERGFWYA